MRVLLAVSLTAVAFAASAQSTSRPLPAGTMPLEEVPAPPPMTQVTSTDTDNSLTPQVTRREIDGQVVEEHRAGGRVIMQRVTPRHGRSYVLMDSKTDGSLTKQDNTIDGRLAVPQWILMEF